MTASTAAIIARKLAAQGVSPYNPEYDAKFKELYIDYVANDY